MSHICRRFTITKLINFNPFFTPRSKKNIQDAPKRSIRLFFREFSITGPTPLFLICPDFQTATPGIKKSTLPCYQKLPFPLSLSDKIAYF
jgi:hypothetical protein